MPATARLLATVTPGKRIVAFNIAYLARESAKTYPDKPALIFDGGVLTFGQVDALSDQLAAGLDSQGLVRGDRVGLQYSTSRNSQPTR
jgi:acyl-CoA synthetase (AMP-forming)/AMP-acid ligase II